MTEEAVEALDRIKNALASVGVMAIPDYTGEFVLQTDASKVGIGAVLSQLDLITGTLRPVMLASRRT